MLQTNDYSWCYEELSKNAVFRKLTPELQLWVISEALAFGERAAVLFGQEHAAPRNEAELVALIEKTGAKLRKQSRPVSPGKLAEYDECSQEIICYTPIIEQAEMLAVRKNPQCFKQFNLLTLCIVHELFHHLENTRFGPASSHVKPEVRWLWLKRKRSIPATREIAAHSFVKAFLGLANYPVVYIA